MEEDLGPRNYYYVPKSGADVPLTASELMEFLDSSQGDEIDPKNTQIEDNPTDRARTQTPESDYSIQEDFNQQEQLQYGDGGGNDISVVYENHDANFDSSEEEDNDDPDWDDETDGTSLNKTKSSRITKSSFQHCGRKPDPIRQEFIIDARGKVKCKYCEKSVTSRPDRMKKHISTCFQKKTLAKSFKMREHRAAVFPPTKGADASTPKTGPMSRFVDKCSTSERKNLDIDVGRFIFECNLPFKTVEHPAFKRLMKRVKPSYVLPSRFKVGTTVLDEVYSEATQEMAIKLKNKMVTIMQDGWSTSQNHPVISHCISTGSETYFYNAIDTGTTPKTAENCFKWLEAAKEAMVNEFNCIPFAVVTDNCNTMNCMRLKAKSRMELHEYGCHTHLLNLLGQKLTPNGIRLKVEKVQNHFRNHHFEVAALAEMGGGRPLKYCKTRWNSQVDLIQSYLKNRLKYLEISERAQAHVPEEIRLIIENNELTKEIRRVMKFLDPIARSLDSLQRVRSNLADGVHEWLKLRAELAKELAEEEKLQVFENYSSQAITPIAAACFILHPVYRGDGLSGAQAEIGRVWLGDLDPYFIAAAAALKAGDETMYPASILNKDVAKLMEPVNWWVDASSSPGVTFALSELAQNLMKLPSSTAGLERCFSTMSNIMTKKRNRLGVKKAGQLCTVYCMSLTKNGSYDMFDSESDIEQE